MIDVDVTVIGGGIVGCAVAAAAARRFSSVVLLEKEDRLASVTTSRNSEVAHGGMYYPAGSAKARLCVEGRRRMKAFCAESGVAYREVGKLIVATGPEQESELLRLRDLGQANDVEGLRLLDAADLRRMEPNVTASAALHSPAPAVFDAEEAALAFSRHAADGGAQLMTGAAVDGLDRRNGGWEVSVQRNGGESWTHRSRWVVNAAGLHSDAVAEMAGIDVDSDGLRLHWVKGSYFSVAPEHAGKVNSLIYPVPPKGIDTLGVHVCLDLAGQLRLGPDYEPLDSRDENYAVDPGRLSDFFAGAGPYLPFLKAADLGPGLAGIRPKLAVAGFADFVIRREEGRREGLINLIGIDSPGLTSSPAIAEEVLRLMADD